MSTARIFDASGGVISTVDTGPKGEIILGQHTDHQSLLDDNNRMRSQARLTGDTQEFTPIAKYHEAMVSHWLKTAGITRKAFATWPQGERLKWLESKVMERDYRKHLRRDIKGAYV